MANESKNEIKDIELARKVKAIFEEHFIERNRTQAAYDICGCELMDMLIEELTDGE